jgi:hypothetical protein
VRVRKGALVGFDGVVEIARRRFGSHHTFKTLEIVGPTVPCSFCLSSLSRILDTITIVRSETVVRSHRMKTK